MATLKISSDLQNVIKKVVLDTYYPVGSLYLTVGSEDPNTTIGGTWVRFGNGKTLVGVDTSQNEFNSVEKTGGSKYMQSHYHELQYYINNGNNMTGGYDKFLVYGMPEGSTYYASHSYPNVPTGDSGNLQPYITVYMWKRTK